MALSGNPVCSFATLPREIRDMVFTHVASAAGVSITIRQTCNLYMDDAKGYAECIIMLHNWASRSHIAKEACEALWATGPFTRQWHSWSDLVIDPKVNLQLYYKRCKSRFFLGAPIDSRKYIKDIDFDVDLPLDNPPYPDLEDERNLSELGQELSNLAMFPRLRQVRINVVIPEESDAYHSGLRLVESLSNPCKQLRHQLGMNFQFSLIRLWPAAFVGRLDISWMWDPPCYVVGESATRELNDMEEHIKALIAHGAPLNGGKTLLEELRAAASKLPRGKGEIVRIKDWTVGCGVSKEEWLWMKQDWGRKNK